MRFEHIHRVEGFRIVDHEELCSLSLISAAVLLHCAAAAASVSLEETCKQSAKENYNVAGPQLLPDVPAGRRRRSVCKPQCVGRHRREVDSGERHGRPREDRAAAEWVDRPWTRMRGFESTTVWGYTLRRR